MQTLALRLTIAVAVALPASAIGLAALSENGQPRDQSRPPASTQHFFPAQPKSPYTKLFRAQPTDRGQHKAADQLDPHPKPSLPPGSHEPQVECKIRAMLVNPSIDRGIRLPPSPDVKAAIRILEHPCLKQ